MDTGIVVNVFFHTGKNLLDFILKNIIFITNKL